MQQEQHTSGQFRCRTIRSMALVMWKVSWQSELLRYSRKPKRNALLKTRVQRHLLTQTAVYMHCWLRWIFLSHTINFQNSRGLTGRQSSQGLPVFIMASHVALLWPLSAELLPSLASVNAQCDSETRASVLVHTISHHYPSVLLTADGCAFVYRKLEMFAPHLLGTAFQGAC